MKNAFAKDIVKCGRQIDLYFLIIQPVTVAIAADHAGFHLKMLILEMLRKSGVVAMDLGTHDEARSDYPDWAKKLGDVVVAGAAPKGIMLCGSGVGACIAANKVRGIRASVCHDTYSAHQGVEHDDMNVLVIGARIIGQEPAFEIVRAFLAAKFNDTDPYRRRLDKTLALERDM